MISYERIEFKYITPRKSLLSLISINVGRMKITKHTTSNIERGGGGERKGERERKWKRGMKWNKKRANKMT